MSAKHLNQNLSIGCKTKNVNTNSTTNTGRLHVGRLYIKVVQATETQFKTNTV